MFLDTSGLLRFLDRREAGHREAAVLFSASSNRLTHTGVATELVALARAPRLARRAVLDFIEELHADSETLAVHVTERLYHDGLDLLAARSDKVWSLCDAMSFLLMEERGFNEAFTADHHFEQAGFVRLLTQSLP